MSECSFTIAPALPQHDAEIEAILDRAFGLGRRTKTSYRFREGETAVPGLSFVALARTANDVDASDGNGSVVGAISFWSLCIGEPANRALLLGPLAVEPHLQGKGIGRSLMRHGVAAADALGHQLIVLVGDEPYYARVGFAKVPRGQLVLPGPVDPDRLLYLELNGAKIGDFSGLVLSPKRFSALHDTTSH